MLKAKMVESRAVAPFRKTLDSYDVKLSLTFDMDEGGRYDQPDKMF